MDWLHAYYPAVLKDLGVAAIVLVIQQALAFAWRKIAAQWTKAANADLTGYWIARYVPQSDPDSSVTDIVKIRHRGSVVKISEWYYFSRFARVYKYSGEGAIVGVHLSSYLYGTKHNREETGCLSLRFRAGILEGGSMQFSLYESDKHQIIVKTDLLYHRYALPLHRRLFACFGGGPFDSFRSATAFVDDPQNTPDTVAVQNYDKAFIKSRPTKRTRRC